MGNAGGHRGSLYVRFRSRRDVSTPFDRCATQNRFLRRRRCGLVSSGGPVEQRWYQEAVVYSLEVPCFQDSDGDGIGDLQGLISRLDYLSRLGVTCLWLNPINPSPWRDNGYDVTDFYAVDPRLGTLGDFAALTRAARERGLRIL